MSAGLNVKSIDDFVEATLAHYDRGPWVDLSLVNQNYIFMSRFMNMGEGDGADRKFRQKNITGGRHLAWKVQIANTNNAHAAGLYAENRTDIVNGIKEAWMPWALHRVSMSYDIYEEELQGTEPDRIIDYIMMRENMMMNDFAEYMETLLWSSPASSDLEPMEMAGIPYWLQRSATFGLTGGNPAGWSGGAGNLSSTTYGQWKNRAGTYNRVSRDDMVDKIMEHLTKANYKAPHSGGNKVAQGPSRYEIFTTYAVVAETQRYLDARSDNTRTDGVAGIAPGQASIAGVPMSWVAKLSNNEAANARTYDSTDPLYGVDFNQFEFFSKPGQKWRRDKPVQAPNQSTVRTVYCYSLGNTRCVSRRQNWTLYRA